MKIVKATETGPMSEELALIPVPDRVKEDAPAAPKRMGSFFTANKKRALVAISAVLIICGAIALNWLLFGGGKDFVPPDDTVGNDDDSYFAMANLDRQRTRDEALEILQSVSASTDASAEEKSSALAAMAAISANMQNESNIENLIKAKGFTNCLAIVSGDNATITVESEGLLANELAQIWEIVYIQAGVLPINCTINERAPA